jgi:hypothetical protein
VFPYATRARGIAIFQFWGKAAQFFGIYVNPIGRTLRFRNSHVANRQLTGTQAIDWKYLLVYCCWIFAEVVMIWFLWPETSGRSLEELAFRK